MSEEETADIKFPSHLFDRMAGLLVLLQDVDFTDALFEIGNIRKLSSQLLTELQPLRGPWAVCMLCKPPFRLKMSEVKEHDIQKHGRVFRG
jgi:hypothetical protein